VSQQRHVIDRVNPGDHPRDQARDLQVSVDAGWLAQLDVLLDEPLEPSPPGQLQHWRQAGARHEVRVIERGGDVMTDSHPADALLCVAN
jgi:hypothetical protein